MIFSKSFAYAMRGILYVAIASKYKERVQLDEIAETLNLPRFFLGKVMRKVSKEGILKAEKGHRGGFSLNESTLNTSLLKVVECTGGGLEWDSCVLCLRKCNAQNPCPVHYEMKTLRDAWYHLLSSKTIGDIVTKDTNEFIYSISAK